MPEPASALPAGWTSPELSLIVAATPRSGSTLLSRLIDTTGPFLLTEEYFNDGKYENQYGLANPTIARKLEEIDRHSRSVTNSISVKLFPSNMRQVLASDTLAAFNNARYVSLVRNDLLGQAISLYRATVTEQWLSSNEQNGRMLQYDAREIGVCLAQIADWNRWWQLFFAVRKVPVLHLTYEALEADPEAEVAKVMSFLGFDPESYPADLSQLKMRKLRDQLTDEWRERFLSDVAKRPELVQTIVPRTFRNAVRFFGKRLCA